MMKENENILRIFYQGLLEAFAITILITTLVGSSALSTISSSEGLFRLDEGLAFEGIIQLFIWSCVISSLVTVLTSDIWFSKILLLWRVAVLMLLGVVVSIAFAIVFRWFPLDSWEAWSTFLIFFVVGFGTGLTALIIKTKIEDNRYNKLLSNYKSKQRED